MTTQAELDSRSLEEMPLFDPQTLRCPYHFDSTLREQAPVYQDPTSGVYIVSTYDLVREVHRKSNVFSNEFTLALGSAAKIDPDVFAAMKKTYDLGKGTMLTVDEPQHSVYRNTVKDYFLAPNVAQHSEWIRQRANELVDKIPDGEVFNFIEHFSRPFPLSVIMHTLGMPMDMIDKAFQWTVDNVTVLSQVADKDALLAAHAGLKEEYDWFAQALNERRENPRDDLLSLVAHARIEEEDRTLTIEEQLSHCTQFLVAGNETTTATLAEGVRQLCLFPEQQAKVRADRSLIPNLVEESLRLATPTSNMWRLAKEDYELGGVTIPAGSMVLLKYFSSNHDSAMFEDPMAFNVERPNVKRHIAFGFGPHVCIGQHLSKLEMTIAWEVLFERTSGFELAVDPAELEYMPNILLRGMEEIPVRIHMA